jgi:hypothetical protein
MSNTQWLVMLFVISILFPIIDEDPQTFYQFIHYDNGVVPIKMVMLYSYSLSYYNSGKIYNMDSSKYLTRNISEPVRGKTKGTTTFLPTLEQGSQITCPIHPLA